jgi:hypothetical protein
MAMIFLPLMSSPEAYTTTPPIGVFVGLVLMVVPFGIWGLTILGGLWGAVACLGGHDFRYAVIGNWLDKED